MALEDKVKEKESKGFMRKAVNLGIKGALALGATAFSIATVGSLGIVVGGAFTGGRLIGNSIRKTPLYDSIDDALKSYTAINAILSPIIWLGDATLPLFKGAIAKTAYALTAYNAAFVAAYKGAEHLYENNLNPKGIISSIKDNFFNNCKRIALVFAPAYTLVANGITQLAGLPVFALNAFPAGIINTLYPIKKSHNQSYSLSPQPSPA